MPRDEWKRANDRSEYGPVRAEKKKDRKRGRHHKPKRRGTGAYNGNMKMWFGKHKGEPLKDVPEPYLRWLAFQPRCQSWQINALCCHLRGKFNHPEVGN